MNRGGAYSRPNDFDERPVGGRGGGGGLNFDDVPVGGAGRGGYSGGPAAADPYPARRGGPNEGFGYGSSGAPTSASSSIGGAPRGAYPSTSRRAPFAGTRFQNINFTDIVMWKDPKQTAPILAGIMLIIFVFGFMEYTIVTFLCRVAQIFFVSYWVLSYTGRVPATGSDEMQVMIRDTVAALEPVAISVLDRLFRVLAWENPFLTLKCIFFSIFLGMLGNVFSDVTLMFLATVVVFIGPLAYSHNKAIVDPVASQLNARANRVVDSIRVGPRSKAE